MCTKVEWECWVDIVIGSSSIFDPTGPDHLKASLKRGRGEVLAYFESEITAKWWRCIERY